LLSLILCKTKNKTFVLTIPTKTPKAFCILLHKTTTIDSHHPLSLVLIKTTTKLYSPSPIQTKIVKPVHPPPLPHPKTNSSSQPNIKIAKQRKEKE